MSYEWLASGMVVMWVIFKGYSSIFSYNKSAQSNLGRGLHRGAVYDGAIWQRGRKWSPEDGEFTTPHQLVPLLWAKPAPVKNIRGTLRVHGCVKVTQVCLVQVTFDHYAVRLVILPTRIISRHPITPTGDSHGFATSILPNIVVGAAVTTTARIAIS